MSAKTRREQHQAELRTLVLDAARDLFVRDGYGQVSMRKLAEKIDYSPGIIYLHFASKDELLNSLVEESFEKLAASLEQTRRNDPIQTLRLGLHAYVDFGLRHPNHYHFAFVLRQQARKPYRPHKAFEYLRDRVRGCIEAGRFRRVDAETAAQMLWATVHGLASLLIARPGFPWVGRDRLVRETIDNAIRGLLAPKGG